MTENFRKQFAAKPPRLVRRAELRRIVPLADTTIYDMECKGQRRERSLRSLYCCSDGVRGRSAAVTYLSHRASFHSNERITPSKRGIKQLNLASRIPCDGDRQEGDRHRREINVAGRRSSRSERPLRWRTGVMRSQSVCRPRAREVRFDLLKLTRTAAQNTMGLAPGTLVTAPSEGSKKTKQPGLQ